MSLTSYRAAPPRDKECVLYEGGLEDLAATYSPVP